MVETETSESGPLVQAAALPDEGSPLGPMALALIDGTALDTAIIKGVRVHQIGGINAVEVQHGVTGEWLEHYQTRDYEKAQRTQADLVEWLYGGARPAPEPDAPLPAAETAPVAARVPQETSPNVGAAWPEGKPMPRDPWRPVDHVGWNRPITPVSPSNPDTAELDRQEKARQAGAKPGDNGAYGYLPMIVESS